MTTRWTLTAFALTAAAVLAGSAGSLGRAQDPGGGAAAPAKPAEPEATAADRALVEAMRTQLEKMTPRRFTRPVQVKRQSEEGFRAYMRKEMDKEFTPEIAEGASASMAALGLLPEGTDIRQVAEDTFAAAVAAYYDSETDTFFVVKQGLPPMAQKPTFLHELQHALQDQVLNLDSIMNTARAARDNGDQGQALRFLWEGEAKFIETLYAAKEFQGADLLALPPATTEMIFRRVGEMTYEQMMAQQRLQAPLLGEDAAKGLKALEQAPRFMVQTMTEAYTRGMWSVWRVYKAGGWAAVDTLFKHPPTSTEQMLHPDTKLLGKRREEPVAVTLPDLKALTGERVQLIEDTYGEHNLQVLLQCLLPEINRGRATTAAAGWGGDRMRVYRKLDGQKALVVWTLVWDTVADATQWAEAYRICAKARSERTGWPATVVEQREHAVAVIEGADAELGAKLAAALLDAAPPLPAKKAAATDGTAGGKDGQAGDGGGK